MSFYPDGYTPKESNSDYMKFEEGENRIRILREPIMGFEFWWEDEGRKVGRVKTYAEAANNVNASDGIKEFHAFIVWDYGTSSVKLLNVTQKSIQKAIYMYSSDEDWGEPTGYDLVINRTGEGLKTEYSVIAKPAKDTPSEAVRAYKEVTIKEDEYFTGGHPIVREEAEEETVDSNDIPF